MILIGMNYACLLVGSVSASLVSKFYFIHKGSSRWVSTLVQCAGFPLLIPFIYIPHYLFPSISPGKRPFSRLIARPRILGLSLFVGLLLGVNNLLFSWGNSYLPLSTSSLLLSSQLAFNLILSIILVKQKVNFHNLNCVVLLSLASVLLALSTHHDRPQGLTHSEYLVGFFCTIGAGLLFAFYLPLMEIIYRNVDSYSMVMEMQVVMEAAATALAVVGMAVDKGGFKEMVNESRNVFDLDACVYWWTIAGNVVMWQACFMGTAGMVFLTTSLTGGICTTALMMFNVTAGVLVYGDPFNSLKAVSTVLCCWGFCSYLYGMYVKLKEEEKKKLIEEQKSKLHFGIGLERPSKSGPNANF
ncbi:probable purine permease 4 [Impatiens glandulifera]|uniref:probable purine permease 4 n=1 Tax=Impatiens glandulifera TaxID=253017 RepID=UPI001FB07622|nr:probable purine permease 4 [Impatiens glandulifera]